jgi:hypothetical protein
MIKEFITKDRGERIEYKSGMRRDTLKGKPDYTLCYLPMLKRWAALMTRGADKYGRRNWELANSPEEMERFKASAFRHMMQWITGEDPEEDHAAAVFFNISAAEMIKNKLNKNK